MDKKNTEEIHIIMPCEISNQDSRVTRGSSVIRHGKNSVELHELRARVGCIFSVQGNLGFSACLVLIQSMRFGEPPFIYIDTEHKGELDVGDCELTAEWYLSEQAKALRAPQVGDKNLTPSMDDLERIASTYLKGDTNE